MAGEFLDSNILVYAFTLDPRAATAQALLARGCTISVQNLNEFANVARRKLGMSWRNLDNALSAIRTLCPRVLPLAIETHADAMRVAGRYGCSIFDSLVIASALQAGSDRLWSEDMHHGMVIDERLSIVDPFRNGG
ncbi:MAG: PIN domain-containing protein [Stellaceae bacterium]